MSTPLPSSSKVLLPPHRIPITTPSIFLAGSIEMGKAIDWQGPLTTSLSTQFSSPSSAITIFNPRRTDWDSTWIQDISCPQFSEQVNWELDHIHEATVVALYFHPGTMSPISLLELGLLAGEGKGKMVVCCPEGYWRRGNVQVVCQRYGVELVETLEEMQDRCVERLREAIEKRRVESEK